MDITPYFVAVVLGLGLWLLHRIKTRPERERRQFIAYLRKLHKTNHRLAYNLYLDSPYWQEKRKRCFDHFFNRCALCGSPHNLQAHHTSYRHLFDELLCELVCLCADCHAKYAPKSAGLYKGDI